jgi:hypothetical protein
MMKGKIKKYKITAAAFSLEPVNKCHTFMEFEIQILAFC